MGRGCGLRGPLFSQITLVAVLRIKRRMATTEAGKSIKKLLLIIPEAVMGGLDQGGGCEGREKYLSEPLKVPFLWSNISGFMWSNLTVRFWMYMDNTFFSPLKRGRKRNREKVCGRQFDTVWSGGKKRTGIAELGSSPDMDTY